MRAMHGLQALPEYRPDKRRNAMEYQSNSATWCMTNGVFTFKNLPATLSTARFNTKKFYVVITLRFNVFSENTTAFALHNITDWFSKPRRSVFTAWYELSAYITHIRLVL
jgi:hypothetical protein